VKHRAGTGRAPKASHHPFAASGDDVEAVLFDLAQRAEVGRFYEVGEVVSETLWLPSGPGKVTGPVPSPRLVFDSADDDGRYRGRVRLRPWTVSGVVADLEILLRVLADMPMHEEPAPTAEDLVLGGGLRFWSHAAKLALELTARQRFVPTFTLANATEGRTQAVGWAYWTPSLNDPVEQERIAALAATLPGAAAATFKPQDRGAITVRPRETIRHFLTTAVDTVVRWSNMASYPSTGRELERVRSAGAAERWFRALHDEPRVTGPREELERLDGQVDAWTAELRAGSRAAGFRTCFRLDPPDETNSDEPHGGRKPRRKTKASDDSAPGWHVRFFLQASDDRSLLVPAERVWKARGHALRYLKRRFDRPQERLLADLGRAASVFPALESSLRVACPEACLLTTEQAYAFLRETAWLLEDSGFGVLVPNWWTRRGTQRPRIGVRMRLSGTPGESQAQGQLGMNTLVRYDWELALGDERLTKDEFKRLAALKAPLVQVRGQWVELRTEQVEALRRFWESGQADQEMALGEALRTSLGEGAVGALPVLGVEAVGEVAELLDGLKDVHRLTDIPAPEQFHGTLRPYQARGLSWLVFLRRWGLGACLADDMGLGKTIQLLALLLHTRNGGDGDGAAAKPTLVVCPTSVVSNWAHEAARFAPDLRVMVHHGPDRHRDGSFRSAAGKHDLVVTSYALVRREAKLFTSVTWDCVALDEAQNIKSVSAQVSQTARKLTATHRIALTGTPVENRLSELWSIMDFLNPGYLGPLTQFKRQFATPIERYEDPDATQRLQGMVQPFLLRRLKTDPDIVADLPKKLEMKVYCSLTREQATLYEAIVQESLQEIESATGIQRKGAVLATLTKLKQVCNHPAQFLHDESSLAGRSGKLARLTEMLEECITASDRALVFTQFAEMGRMLRSHLQSVLGREVLFLHGGTTLRRRDKMIDRFQNTDDAPPVFLLSLKAGGTGLNLTRANHVFHFDRWWNPAVEDQATDRAFRIGQTRNVQVHKYVCAGTLEEQIDAMIESKKALASSVISSGEAWLTELSTNELRDLLQLRPGAVMDGE